MRWHLLMTCIACILTTFRHDACVFPGRGAASRAAEERCHLRCGVWPAAEARRSPAACIWVCAERVCQVRLASKAVVRGSSPVQPTWAGRGCSAVYLCLGVFRVLFTFMIYVYIYICYI